MLMHEKTCVIPILNIISSGSLRSLLSKQSSVAQLKRCFSSDYRYVSPFCVFHHTVLLLCNDNDALYRVFFSQIGLRNLTDSHLGRHL